MIPSKSNPLGGIALMCGAAATFACLDATTKYLAQTLPVPQIVWARYTSHMVLMLLVLGPSMGMGLVRTRRLPIQLLRSVLLLASTTLFLTALVYLPLAEATAMTFMSPLLVTALSVPLLQEKVGPRRWAAVAVGFLGVLIMIRPGGALFHWAAALPLAMAVCYSLFQILTRLISGHENAFTTLFYTALVGTALSSLALPLVWQNPADWREILLLVVTGVFGGVGHFLLIMALARAPASVIAPFSFTLVLWATLLGYLIFDALPDAWSFGGMAVIASAGLYIWQRERKVSGAVA